MIRRTLLKSGGSGLSKRGRPLQKRGSTAEKWSAFRNAAFLEDCDEEGLIRCQDVKIGLPHCGYSRDSSGMDLHHVEGRDGKLLLDRSKMVWLIRECHQKAHGQ